MIKNKIAFTLPEIIVSIFISTIILSFLFIFLNDSISSVSLSKNKALIVGEFNDFNIKLKDFKINYSSWNVINNNLLVFKNENLTRWIIVWPVNLENNKIDTDFSTYEKVFLWYRDLSETELNLLNSWSLDISNLVYQDDKIFKNIHLKDFSISSFNSGSIFDINMTINPFFQETIVWESWSNLDLQDLFKLNITL